MVGEAAQALIADLLMEGFTVAALVSAIVYLRMRKKILRLEREHEEDDRKLRGVDALRQRLLAGIEAAGEGVALIDDDGRLTYMNSALMAIHAVPAAQAPEFIGRDWRLLYSPTGRRNIDAREAKVWGLLHDVVGAEDLESFALDWADELTRNAPLSVRGNKRVLRALLAAEAALEPAVEAELIALRKACFESEDLAEGVKAFGEKRPARWQGR